MLEDDFFSCLFRKHDSNTRLASSPAFTPMLCLGYNQRVKHSVFIKIMCNICKSNIKHVFEEKHRVAFLIIQEIETIICTLWPCGDDASIRYDVIRCRASTNDFFFFFDESINQTKERKALFSNPPK